MLSPLEEPVLNDLPLFPLPAGRSSHHLPSQRPQAVVAGPGQASGSCCPTGERPGPAASPLPPGLPLGRGRERWQLSGASPVPGAMAALPLAWLPAPLAPGKEDSFCGASGSQSKSESTLYLTWSGGGSSHGRSRAPSVLPPPAPAPRPPSPARL